MHLDKKNRDLFQKLAKSHHFVEENVTLFKIHRRAKHLLVGKCWKLH